MKKKKIELVFLLDKTKTKKNYKQKKVCDENKIKISTV
jgi:hypothetical protein